MISGVTVGGGAGSLGSTGDSIVYLWLGFSDTVMTASISAFGRAAVGAHVVRSARGPGTLILLKSRSRCQIGILVGSLGCAAGSCGVCAFERTRRAG